MESSTYPNPMINPLSVIIFKNKIIFCLKKTETRVKINK